MEDQFAFFDSDLGSTLEVDHPADGSSFAPAPPSASQINHWLRFGSRQAQEQLDKRLRAAVACGFEEIVLQLLEKGANPNSHDNFTGWTCLHWAAALRRVRMMALLEAQGASFVEVDLLQQTPLDFIGEELSSYHNVYLDKDRLLNESGPRRGPRVNPKVLFTWGDSSNYTLGREASSKSGNDIPRVVTFPFASDKTFVTGVVVSQYHSLATASDGSLWSWGLGEGGRLGYVTDIQPLPKRVKDLSNETVVQALASLTISATVTESGKLYLFGKTETGQFGDGNRKQKSEHPSAVPTLKKYHIVQAALSNVHVAALTDEGSLWTWGKGEAGQLGHGSLEEELLPRLVPLTNCKIVSMVCKDSLTALFNEKNDMYWFGLGQSKPMRIKFSFGYPSLHRAGSFQIVSMCCTDSALFFLVDEGSFGRNVYSFRPNIDTFPNLINFFSQANEGVQVEVAQGSLFLVTRLGALYSLPLASLFSTKSPIKATDPSNKSLDPLNKIKMDRSTEAIPLCSSSPVPKTSFLSSSPPIPAGTFIPPSSSKPVSSSSAMTSISETRICHEIRPIRVSASSHHMAALCEGPRAPLSKIPIPPSTWKDDFVALVKDPLKCDVVIIHPSTKKELLHGHSIFLSRSPALYSALMSESNPRNEAGQVVIEAKWGVNPKAWAAVWKYLLTDEIDLSDEDSTALSAQSKSNLQDAVRDLSQALKLNSLFAYAAYHRVMKDGENLPRTPSLKEHITASVLSGSPALANLRITTEKGVEVAAHSAVLLQRSEYFRTMLKAAWRESQNMAVHLEESSVEAVRALLVYLYADDLMPGLSANVQVELLLLADRLFLPRLKEMCANWLLQNVSPDNAMQLIEIADLTQMTAFREGVIEYIAINLELFLRNKLLSQLDEETLRSVDHFVAVHFLDAPYLHFTQKRQKYITEFVQNLVNTPTPPKANRPRQSSKEGTDPPLSSTLTDLTDLPLPLSSTPPLSSPNNVIPQEGRSTLTSSTEKFPNPLSKSVSKLELTPALASSSGPLTPAQKKQLKSSSNISVEPSPSPSSPSPSPSKPAWGSIATSPSSAPSLSSIMSEEVSKNPKPNAAPHLSPSPAKQKTPTKAWSNTPTPSPSPIKFEDIAQDQRKEKEKEKSPNAVSSPMKIGGSNTKAGLTSSPLEKSPSPKTLEAFLPSSSPPQGPVVHRHIWGAPVSAPSSSSSPGAISPSPDATTFLSPTPKDAAALLEGQKFDKKAKAAPATSSGPWSQHTPNLLNIMSEQFIEKIVKEDEVKPQPQPTTSAQPLSVQPNTKPGPNNAKRKGNANRNPKSNRQ